MFKRRARSTRDNDADKNKKAKICEDESSPLSDQDFAYRTPTILPESRTKDYYAVLGVKETCSPEDIRTAYRHLARLCHPDKNKGNADAVRRFIDVKEAYDKLHDTGMRNRYDQMVFREIMLWSRISEDSQRRKGGMDDAPLPGEPDDEIVYYVEGAPMVEFEVPKESIEAGTIEGAVTGKYRRLCRTCDSYGYKLDDKENQIKTKDCEKCAGTGKKEVRFKGIGAAGAQDMLRHLRCLACAGLGTTLDMERCPECEGKGFEKQVIERKMTFSVPLYTSRRKRVHVIHLKSADPEYANVYVAFKYPQNPTEARRAEDIQGIMPTRRRGPRRTANNGCK